MKEYKFDKMSIEEIADVCADLNSELKEREKAIEKAKTVVKARYGEEEIGKLSQGKTGEIEVRESDDFHPIDPMKAFQSMVDADFGDDFPKVCNIQLNDSGKKAKVKKLGLSHFLPAAVIEKIRIKKRKKALTVFFRKQK